jgi:tetratricopeptide (TPR) repeat protein
MGEHTLTLLHLSDLHEDATTSWRRRRVLGDAWKRNLDEMAAEGSHDLVCFTGDAVFSGQAAEYERATVFFEAVLERLGLGRERFFPVPGNHDINRGQGAAEWRALRDKLPRARREEVAAWLAGGRAPLGFDDGEREAVLARLGAYHEWVHGDLGRPELDPAMSGHGRLGYRWTWPAGSLGALPFPVQIVGLDSAWACGDGNDAGKLWLTDEQVMRLAADEGEPLAGFRLALVHHPLDELADGAEMRRLLAERVDLVLRGHLHDAEVQEWADPERRLLQLVGGCLYEHDRYPNGCARLRVTLDSDGRPQRHELWFRGWSERGHWQDDDSLYPGTRNGRLTWWMTGRPAEAAPDGRVERVFVGREPELEQLKEHLLAAGGARPVAVCSLQGMAGVGKSYLADRFALLHRERFPGGVWRLVLEAGSETPTPVKLLGELADRLKLAPSGDGLPKRVRDRLLHPASLLHIENVDREPLAEAAAGLVALLPGCAVLVTGRYQGLGATAGWAQVRLQPFDEGTALAQLDKELGPEAVRHSEEERQRLVRAVGYLPLAVHLAAGHLGEGFSVSVFLDRLRATGFSLAGTEVVERVQSALTGEIARQAIASTFTLSLDALGAHLAREAERDAVSERLLAGLFDLGYAPAAGFGESLGAALTGLALAEFERLAAAARRLSVLEAVAPAERRDRAWRLHPLLGELLRARGGSDRTEAVHARMSEWFCSRLPELPLGHEEEQGRRWREVQADTGSLVAWLDEVPPGEAVEVARAGSSFAMINGPFHAWLTFCERTLAQLSIGFEDFQPSALDKVALTPSDPAVPGSQEMQELALLNKGRTERRGLLLDALLYHHPEGFPVLPTTSDSRSRAAARSAVLAALSAVARRAGNWRRAEEAAREKIELDRKRGDEEGLAFAWGLLLAVYQGRGELDEVIRIRRQEQLPCYERVGNLWRQALVLGEIANVHEMRGELDEALRLREELLQRFQREGDLFDLAETYGRIARVHEIRGELDEALRIRQQKQIPLLDKLGAGGTRGMALCEIAEIFARREEFQEALRILREEVLPVFNQLGNEHLLAVALGRLAAVLRTRGDHDEALRILREEHLPIYERLGDVRQVAVGLDMMAMVLRDRGEAVEALSILRRKVLPVFEKLGDEHARAVILGRIAGTLMDLGEIDEAVGIMRDEEIPVYERLGLKVELLGGRRRLAKALLARGQVGDRDEARRLLEQAHADAERMGLQEAKSIWSKLHTLSNEGG